MKSVPPPGHNFWNIPYYTVRPQASVVRWIHPSRGIPVMINYKASLVAMDTALRDVDSFNP